MVVKVLVVTHQQDGGGRWHVECFSDGFWFYVHVHCFPNDVNDRGNMGSLVGNVFGS